MTDIGSIAWKEWRELLGQRGFRGKQGIVLFIATFGIVLPWQTGSAWVTSPAILVGWSWIPMFLVTTVIADAFAGERERHTLETLLASRLSDRAILFGKIGAAIGYSFAVTTASLFAGLLTVNLAHPREGLLLYDLNTVLAMAVLGLLGAVFVAAVGVLISLRAATVKVAQQALAGTIMVLLLAVVGILRGIPTTWKHQLLPDAVSVARLGILALVIFAVLDAGAVALALLRFRRSRLIAE